MTIKDSLSRGTVSFNAISLTVDTVRLKTIKIRRTETTLYRSLSGPGDLSGLRSGSCPRSNPARLSFMAFLKASIRS